MIKADMIPIEVKLRLRNVLSDGETDEAVALAAALNAWPDVLDTHPNNIGHLVLQFKK